jgi:hypothetical protein
MSDIQLESFLKHLIELRLVANQQSEGETLSKFIDIYT